MTITGMVSSAPDTVQKIFFEMLLFLALLLVSEMAHVMVRLKSPTSSLLKYFHIARLVLAWFTTSITLILYNKWILNAQNQNAGEAPVTYTTFHMLIKGVLAVCYFRIWKCKPFPAVGIRVCIGLSLAGAFASLDIMMSNMSLFWISTSFYTFLKSASLIFVLVLALITCVEPPSMSIISTVVLVSLGMCLMYYGEHSFSLHGTVYVLASELFAALRWIVTQVMVQEHNIDAMTAVLYMAPAATLTLVPGIVGEVHVLSGILNTITIAKFITTYIFPGVLAFLLLLIEVQILKETSSLTLTVFGNLKAVLTILFAVAVFHDSVSTVQWAGLMVAFTGMLAYSYARGDLLSEDSVHKIKRSASMERNLDFTAQNYGTCDQKNAKEVEGDSAA
eukprot:TRINITY_DN6524_c0_g1_i3.p1 TRINITY_DN6524_c0_g1~~TRINITY_DN6524_c0_g1_i3.p1  ORF type:complete len:391 (+),score=32.34 TRINITY_DN6524_c0_g1_i3:65-1237(+)